MNARVLTEIFWNDIKYVDLVGFDGIDAGICVRIGFDGLDFVVGIDKFGCCEVVCSVIEAKTELRSVGILANGVGGVLPRDSYDDDVASEESWQE